MNGKFSTHAVRDALCLVLGAVCTLYFVGAAGAVTSVTMQLGAARDTMIFQNVPNNGAGGAPGFFAGTSNSSPPSAPPPPRRGLIEFDVSSIPTNAVITDVQLRLVIGQAAGGGAVPNPTIGLHKLLVDWGEADTGKSTATGLNGIGQGMAAESGDATWNARFFGSVSPWGQPGGQAGVDYVSTASASLVQGNVNLDVSLWLSTTALVADVQSWIGSPTANHGWMLINANETSAQTFRGFYSRDYNPNNNPDFPDLQSYFPRLIVSYNVPEPSSIVLLSLAVGTIAATGRRVRRA